MQKKKKIKQTNRVKDCKRANTEPAKIRVVRRAFFLIELRTKLAEKQSRLLNRTDLKYELWNLYPTPPNQPVNQTTSTTTTTKTGLIRWFLRKVANLALRRGVFGQCHIFFKRNYHQKDNGIQKWEKSFWELSNTWKFNIQNKQRTTKIKQQNKQMKPKANEKTTPKSSSQ